jgi:hypothetical protein
MVQDHKGILGKAIYGYIESRISYVTGGKPDLFHSVDIDNMIQMIIEASVSEVMNEIESLIMPLDEVGDKDVSYNLPLESLYRLTILIMVLKFKTHILSVARRVETRIGRRSRSPAWHRKFHDSWERYRLDFRIEIEYWYWFKLVFEFLLQCSRSEDFAEEDILRDHIYYPKFWTFRRSMITCEIDNVIDEIIFYTLKDVMALWPSLYFLGEFQPGIYVPFHGTSDFPKRHPRFVNHDPDGRTDTEILRDRINSDIASGKDDDAIMKWFGEYSDSIQELVYIVAQNSGNDLVLDFISRTMDW